MTRTQLNMLNIYVYFYDPTFPTDRAGGSKFLCGPSVCACVCTCTRLPFTCGSCFLTHRSSTFTSKRMLICSGKAPVLRTTLVSTLTACRWPCTSSIGSACCCDWNRGRSMRKPLSCWKAENPAISSGIRPMFVTRRFDRSVKFLRKMVSCWCLLSEDLLSRLTSFVYRTESKQEK